MSKGILNGLGAYALWGFFPIYWKFLQNVPALQVIGHRIGWSFLFLLLILLITRQWNSFRASALTPKILAIYSIAAVLLSVNWLFYVWGVNAGFIVETSLGYFINPLVSVLLGVALAARLVLLNPDAFPQDVMELMSYFASDVTSVGAAPGAQPTVRAIPGDGLRIPGRAVGDPAALDHAVTELLRVARHRLFQAIGNEGGDRRARARQHADEETHDAAACDGHGARPTSGPTAARSTVDPAGPPAHPTPLPLSCSRWPARTTTRAPGP